MAKGSKVPGDEAKSSWSDFQKSRDSAIEKALGEKVSQPDAPVPTGGGSNVSVPTSGDVASGRLEKEVRGRIGGEQKFSPHSATPSSEIPEDPRAVPPRLRDEKYLEAGLSLGYPTEVGQGMYDQFKAYANQWAGTGTNGGDNYWKMVRSLNEEYGTDQAKKIIQHITDKFFEPQPVEEMGVKPKPGGAK